MNFLIFKKNNGFVILFAVTISAILLAIALGVSNIALKQVNFSTSAQSTENSFFAADTGAECALFYDKSTNARFNYPNNGAQMTCAGATVSPNLTGDASAWVYTFTVPNLGVNGSGCANVTVTKSNSSGVISTTMNSKGYNIGGSTCVSTNANRTEREIIVSYALAGITGLDGSCGTTQFTCNSGTVSNTVDGPSSWTWSCDGSTGGVSVSCSKNKPVQFASGGTMTTSGAYTIHTFTSGGSFTVLNGSGSVDYLLVGGGGGGGSAGAVTGTGGSGGGGGGGVKEISNLTVSQGAPYTIVVGSGGSGAPNTGGPGLQGGDGGASSAFGQSVSGGGGGGGYDNPPTSGTIGRSGGSGGGGAGNGSNAGGAGVSGQGGNGRPAISIDGGGGGGKSNATPSWGSAGIAGASSSYSGSTLTYGGGGGGGANQVQGNTVGGTGGGGNGSSNTSTTAATAGADGLGGGGGGGYGQAAFPAGQSGKNGGSGIVIIRYLTPQ